MIDLTLIRKFLADPECNPETGHTLKRHSRLFDRYIDLCKASDEVAELCRLFATRCYKNPVDGTWIKRESIIFGVYRRLGQYFGISNAYFLDFDAGLSRPAISDIPATVQNTMILTEQLRGFINCDDSTDGNDSEDSNDSNYENEECYEYNEENDEISEISENNEESCFEYSLS